MLPTTLRTLLFISLLLLCSINSLAASNDKPPFWLLEKGHTKIYLLGSIHLGKAEMYPLPDAIEQAFKQSNTLFVEADLNSERMPELLAPMLSLGMYTDGSSLQQHLTAAQWQQLQQQFKKSGLPEFVFAQQKPWMASVTLSILAMKQLGFSEQYGVDFYFMQRANQAGQPKVIELESALEQLQMMAKLPDAAQLAMLQQALIQIEQPQMLQQLYQAWRQGDEAQLQQLVNDSFSDETATSQLLEKQLLHDRNINMSKTLSQLTRRGGNYFVVVGAAHLPGKLGLVELLKQQGFSAKRPLHP